MLQSLERELCGVEWGLEPCGVDRGLVPAVGLQARSKLQGRPGRPTSLSVHPPISPPQQPPAISPAEAAVVARSPVSLTQPAESSSGLPERFSQGSHNRDEQHAVPERDCIICYAERADAVFMPCKHLVVCAVCWSCGGVWCLCWLQVCCGKMLAEVPVPVRCPVCRTRVLESVRWRDCAVGLECWLGRVR